MADLRSHSEPSPDVAGYLLGALDPDEARDFAAHLSGCPACREELEALAGVTELLRDLPPALPLPPDLEQRTFARIDAAAAQDPEPNRTPAGGAGGAGRIVPIDAGRTVPINTGRRRTSQWLTAAAVAVVVLAAGIGIAVNLRHTAPTPIATVRLISADGGPAHATATIRAATAGLTIDMTVVGLDPSPAGTVYTCWLVAGNDTLNRPDRVSVGSFVVREPNATIMVHWTTAADLALFPHLGVTREPSNGNPAHQGPKVLVAT